MPEIFTGASIPDGDPTPHMRKTFQGESVLTWLQADAEVLIIWTPASPSYPIRLFVKRLNSEWAFLGTLSVNQPLWENYRKARLVSAGLRANSASQAAGVFSLAGFLTCVQLNQVPPFSDLSYNSILSYIPNAGVAEAAVPVEQGILTVHPPDGYTEYFTPDSESSIKVEDYWVSQWVQDVVGDGWIDPNSSTPLAAGASLVLWSSTTANPKTGSPTALPDPFYGYVRMAAAFDIKAAASGGFRFGFNIYRWVADTLTWVVSSVQDVEAIGRYSLSTTPNHVNLDSDRFYSDGLIYKVELFMTNESGAAATITFPALPRDNYVTITSYDTLRPHVQSPCQAIIATRLNVGQPAGIRFTHTYELIPTPKIAKVVPLTTDRPDDIYLEEALAVLSKVGDGVKLVWQAKAYDLAVANRLLHSLSKESTAFEAAGPSLKTRLLDVWRRVSPYVTEAALLGGKHLLKSGLQNAGAVHPALGVAGNLLANEFLSAPASASEYSAADVQKQEEEHREYMAADVDYDIERPSTLLSSTSDFLNIVNQRATQLTGARRAYFPLVPKSFDKETKVVFITFTKDPGGGDFHMATTQDGVSFGYNDFFSTQEEINFLSQLTNYAVACSIINKVTPVYFHVNFPPVDGPSWKLAALMAVLGVSGGSIYSGGVSFASPLRPVLEPIGRTAPKALLAKSLGRPLVVPACIPDSEVGALMSIGPVVYSGFLSSGRPMPPNMSAFLIESPWDAVVLGLRNFKHRITMASDEQVNIQQKSAGYNPQTMMPKPAVVSKKVASALPTGERDVDEMCDRALKRIGDLGISNPDLNKAVERNRVAWKKVLAQQGNYEAFEVQMRAIRDASKKMIAKIEKFYENSVANKIVYGEGKTKSAVQREKKKASQARRREEANWAPENGESESSAEQSRAAEALGIS